MTRKTLGPPRGADETRAAALASRFKDAPAETVAEPKTSTPQTRRSRGEPHGMTRRTLYLPTTVADDLFAAADSIAEANPLATRHQILAALLQHGLHHTDAARADVRQQLMDSLTPE